MYHEQKVPSDFSDRCVCIIGLGYVGLTLAAVMAEVGFHVIGIEKRENLLSKLKSGEPGLFEPGLNTLLKKVISDGSLELHHHIPTNCQATVYIITVGTPVDDDNRINLDSIIDISETLSSLLKEEDMVLLRSTVKLGTTRSTVLPILQKSEKNIHLAFCPERTIEGQAMEELRYLPQIIGADDLSATLRASQIFQFLTPITIRLSDYETAEMVKLVDNARRDVTFAFSNEIAKLCNAIGINADEVISSGRFGYSRTQLPTPGPVGGPCLSKDSHILVQSMQDLYGIMPEITAAARNVNEKQPEEVVNFLRDYLNSLENFPEKPIISLLGIAFKGRPATDDLRGTTARPIFEALKRAFPQALFWGYDPVVDSENLKQFGLCPKGDLKDAISGAHLVMILNNHPIFSSIEIEQLSVGMARPGVIYDFWNCFKKKLSLPKGVQYISLGNHKNGAKDKPILKFKKTIQSGLNMEKTV